MKQPILETWETPQDCTVDVLGKEFTLKSFDVHMRDFEYKGNYWWGKIEFICEAQVFAEKFDAPSMGGLIEKMKCRVFELVRR